MKRAHAAIFLLFVVDKLVFFFYFEMEYEGILVLASQYEKYKTKTKKLVPKKKKCILFIMGILQLIHFWFGRNLCCMPIV